MNRVFEYQIIEEWKSIREFLESKRYPHAVFVKLKKTERSVLVNGEWLHLYQPLHRGDRLEIHLVENENSENIVPRDFGEIMQSVAGERVCDDSVQTIAGENTRGVLPVVYEDEDILIINKPAGLPIHPSQNHYDDSLANAVMDYYKKKNQNFVFRCINRLDRNTSGLTLIAKNMLSSAILSQDVTTRDIHRTYLALVENIDPLKSGDPSNSGELMNPYQLLGSSGIVEEPIGRVDGSTILREVSPENGDYALTKYWKLQDYGDIALLKLQLGTGRTHQIRVHMSHIGHPLIGDDLYGNGTYHFRTKEGEECILNRHALHSYRLEFTHPITRDAMDVYAELPLDLRKITES